MSFPTGKSDRYVKNAIVAKETQEALPKERISEHISWPDPDLCQSKLELGGGEVITGNHSRNQAF